ncbi:MAG: toll/interleukin-1 receptor domain-containing protein [Phycisphaeraceae bacterium]
MSQKTVFISYRRDDVGRSFARSIKLSLTQQGYDVFLDVDDIASGDWATQILTEVPLRAHFLLLLTRNALDRCADENDWVRREFQLAVETHRNIVSVAEDAVELGSMRKACPACVKDLFDKQGHKVRHSAFNADVHELVTRFIPPHKAPAPTSAIPTPTSTPAPTRVDISRIQKYAPTNLIGRDNELKLLNDAWAKVQQAASPRPHILTFVALGGEGKTSLIAHWLATLAARDWPDCDAVYAWSFYSQGTRDQGSASADVFLAEALRFFGDAAMADSPRSAWDKGKRLAELVADRRALLILDGLEPLQYSPSSPTRGQLKEHGLIALLHALAGRSAGLCIITTRYSLPDLQAFRQTTAPEVELKRLSTNAGVHLLQSLGVRKESGSQKDFETLVEEVKGHALTLNLLGKYLHDAHGGDLRKRDLVNLKDADDEEHGGHAFRVMDAYVKWFEDEGEKGKRAIALLRLLGLFDRPASADCFDALLQPPAIADLTDSLVGMSEAQRNIALTRLEDAKLLSVLRDESGTVHSFDCHPLIREYFARVLSGKSHTAWQAGHKRLYEHLCDTTHEREMPTLEQLQPLYQAVAHGCLAGLHQEARDRVYVARILKGARAGGFYSTKQLGAFGADLGAVACFFEERWSRVAPGLRSSDQSWLLSVAAFRLRALGRLREAQEPMRAGLQARVKERRWNNAAIAAGNLSELSLTLGDLPAAVREAEAAVSHADQSGEAFQRMCNRTTLADALHQAGRFAETLDQFREAEKMQKELQPELPLLYSVQCFHFCDLLLADAERAAWRGVTHSDDLPTLDTVQRRATLARDVAARNRWLLDIALDHLTLARIALYRRLLTGTALPNPGDPQTEIAQSVDGLRRAGVQHHLPRGLLTRAWHRHFCGDIDGARADLDEAYDIAQRGPMPLHMADVHLYRARLFKDRAELAKARALIDKHGYERRRHELNDADAALSP